MGEGGDIFKKMASIWLDKAVEMVNEEDRDKTKKVVYALMYGAGKIRLSEILTLTVMQASSIMNTGNSKMHDHQSNEEKNEVHNEKEPKTSKSEIQTEMNNHTWHWCSSPACSSTSSLSH